MNHQAIEMMCQSLSGGLDKICVMGHNFGKAFGEQCLSHHFSLVTTTCIRTSPNFAAVLMAKVVLGISHPCPLSPLLSWSQMGTELNTVVFKSTMNTHLFSLLAVPQMERWGSLLVRSPASGSDGSNSNTSQLLSVSLG